MNERIEHNFTYHPPTSDSTNNCKAVRSDAKILALLIDTLVPDSREKSLALTKLEEVVFWSNAGIVRNQSDE